MAMKHLPATPLPWRVGDAGLTVFGPPNGNPSPETVTAVNGKAGSRRGNAAYIAHAANAYPKLVEMLNDMCGATLWTPGWTEHPEQKRARTLAFDLLQELGELPVTGEMK